MREGQGTKDYIHLYMFLQCPVYLFCIIYNSPQLHKDLKRLYKQNVVNKIIQWTLGYSDMREAGLNNVGGWRMEGVNRGSFGLGYEVPGLRAEMRCILYHASQYQKQTYDQCLKGRRIFLNGKVSKAGRPVRPPGFESQVLRPLAP